MASLCLLRRAASQLHLLSVRRVSTEKVRDPLPSIRFPNSFGNLSQEGNVRIEQLPEEEGDVERVEFIDGIEGKTRMPTFKYSRQIKKLIDKKQLREALDILDIRMKAEKAYPDHYTYNLLISGCAAHGYTKKAFQLFNQMKKRGIVVPGSTYTSLMNACANSPFPEDGLTRVAGLRELMREKGLNPNERTYHAMIKAYGRCGDLEGAFSVVDEMVDRKKLVSNTTYNFLLQACATNKEAGFRHAILVWRNMLSQKIKPTVYNYNMMLRCARDCNVGDIESFEGDIQKMKSPPRKDNHLQIGGKHNSSSLLAGHSCNTATPNLPALHSSLLPSNVPEVVIPNLLYPDPRLGSFVSLMNIKHPWQRLELIGGSSGFLQTMAASRTSPDIKTFTLLLETLEPTNESEEELIKCMKNAKVKLDLDFCNLLIKKRAMSYRFEDAKKALRLIHERSMAPNIVTFGVLALACSDFNDARELVDTIYDKGYRINIEIVGSLFLRASKAYDLKMMRYVIAKMRQEKVKPNKKFLNHINDFQRRVNKHSQKVSSGEINASKLDEPGFIEGYQKMCEIFKKIENSGVEDNDNIHPWSQFKQSHTPQQPVDDTI